MTVGMVPGASIAGMVFSLVVSFALPIGLFVYAKKKLGAKTAPFFIGCGIFFVMVLMLEAAIHRIVFQLAGEALTGSVILYAVYGGLMAALFEKSLSNRWHIVSSSFIISARIILYCFTSAVLNGII